MPSLAFAAPSDVAKDAWYSEAVSSFVDKGFLSGDSPFRPGEAATRAEFIELVVRALGGVIHPLPTQQSFDDVEKDSPYFQYFEEAAASGWMKGTGNCLGEHPCNANPNDPINRAEASMILLRAFSLEEIKGAPAFPDSSDGQWYTKAIRTAAGHCMLQGDAATRMVRPGQNMIRAEMVVMLKRLDDNLIYPNCNASQESILQESPNNATKSLSSSSEQRSSSNMQIWSKPKDVICPESVWKCMPWRGGVGQNCGVRDCKIDYTNPALSTCIDPDRNAPITKQECDLSIVDTVNNYNTMVSNLDQMDSQLPYYSGSTSSLLFQLASQYSAQVSLMKIYYDKAINNTLQPSDNSKVNNIIETANALLDRFDTIAGTELKMMQQNNQAPSPTPNYYVPSPTPSPSYSNKIYCEDLKNSLGISGGWKSSQHVKRTGEQLLNAGCITSAEACSSYNVCN